MNYKLASGTAYQIALLRNKRAYYLEIGHSWTESLDMVMRENLGIPFSLIFFAFAMHNENDVAFLIDDGWMSAIQAPINPKL